MIIYVECKMGIAGDMLMAALYELLSTEKKQQFLDTMNDLFPGSVRLCPAESIKCNIKGTHMSVEIFGSEETSSSITEVAHTGQDSSHHSHAHYTYASIVEKIDSLALPQKVKADATAVYKLLGNAEASVHGTTLTQIHFHEVGSLDAIADVVGNCLLFHMLSPTRIIFSPIHVGNGTVHCAHGILPVPAPATAVLLQNIPFYTGNIDSELCTPTGAALAHYFADEYAAMPVMCNTSCGIGMGSKDFSYVNGVRVFMGEPMSDTSDQILEISCNVDDMTGEELGYAMEHLLDAGALDAFFIPIHMKKNRPGLMICCYCTPSQKEKFTDLFFRHTTTRGVRYNLYSRCKMTSHFDALETSLGTVHRKVNTYGDIQKSKLEYEDLRRIADSNQMSIEQVRKLYEVL